MLGRCADTLEYCCCPFQNSAANTSRFCSCWKLPFGFFLVNKKFSDYGTKLFFWSNTFRTLPPPGFLHRSPLVRDPILCFPKHALRYIQKLHLRVDIRQQPSPGDRAWQATQNYLKFWDARIGFIGRNPTLPNLTRESEVENIRESVQAQLLEPFMKLSSSDLALEVIYGNVIFRICGDAEGILSCNLCHPPLVYSILTQLGPRIIHEAFNTSCL